MLFSSVDTNFDSIANNWYSSQSNGIKTISLICTYRCWLMVILCLRIYFLGTFSYVSRLKNMNPSTKILLLVNEILPESLLYSRRDFIISVADVLKTSKFDGLVISDVIPTTYSKIINTNYCVVIYNIPKINF